MHDKRSVQRIQMEVPVHLANANGMTRDISGSGIFFVTDHSYALGENISFSLDLNYAFPGQPLHLDCFGQVKRIESIGDQVGVAAQIERISCLH
ncbi:MAG: PilZ domain-containing protein [Desulfuromonas sp.]|nr:MAG: PilZ domain-containing protein [Desulfuromonas sp.]